MRYALACKTVLPSAQFMVLKFPYVYKGAVKGLPPDHLKLKRGCLTISSDNMNDEKLSQMMPQFANQNITSQNILSSSSLAHNNSTRQQQHQQQPEKKIILLSNDKQKKELLTNKNENTKKITLLTKQSKINIMQNENNKQNMVNPNTYLGS